MHDTLQPKPASVAIGGVLLLVICFALIGCDLSGASGRHLVAGAGSSKRTTSAYFYDLNTGKVFTAPVDDYPPIAAPSDKKPGAQSGVEAYIFSSGKCASDYSGMTAQQIKMSGAFIGYLQKYNEHAKQSLRELKTNPDQEPDYGPEEGQYVRTLDSDKWVQQLSTPGQAVTNGVYENAPKGTHSKQCSPGS